MNYYLRSILKKRSRNVQQKEIWEKTEKETKLWKMKSVTLKLTNRWHGKMNAKLQFTTTKKKKKKMNSEERCIIFTSNIIPFYILKFYGSSHNNLAGRSVMSGKICENIKQLILRENMIAVNSRNNTKKHLIHFFLFFFTRSCKKKKDKNCYKPAF